MISDKMIARFIGVLFVTTMIAGGIDSYLAMPLLSTPLPNILAHRTTIMLGAFMIIYMSLGVVGIALLMFQILKRQNPLVAAGYLAFRTVECVLLLVGAIVPLCILGLGQSAEVNAITDLPGLQRLVSLSLVLRNSCFQISMLILGLNSLPLCAVLYKTRLLPRWLAAIGFIGYALLLLSAVLDLCGLIKTTGTGALLYAPGGLFELVLLPLWLIIKGFDKPKQT